jgi:hypothetical protein
VFSQYGEVIDPHTADGVKVGLEHARPGETLICLETAAPAKFAPPSARRSAASPTAAGFENLESLPQRFTVVERDVAALKALHREPWLSREERPRRRAARLQLRAAHRLLPRRLLRDARPGRRRAPRSACR